ncbi:MAG: translocation/assembly module TamB domain-containing protein [Cyanobacteriota bacterium]|nr:translocation/assembly module TamB domain-containing protein [Cyanobacteriota bacterium]
MTPTPPTPPQPESGSDRSFGRRLLDFAKRPASIIALSILGLAVTGGYIAIRLLVPRLVPGLVETQLEDLLNRDVEIGEIDRFSWTLTGVRLGETTIYPSEADELEVFVKAIEVNFNPLPLATGNLPIRLTLVEPKLSAAEDENGNWAKLELNIPESEGEPTIDIQPDVRIRDAEVSLLPFGATRPIVIEADGFTQIQERNTLGRYDLTVKIAGGEVAIAGESRLDTLQTKAMVRLNEVQLAQLSPLLPPDIPIRIEDGEVGGNLNVELPSVEEWQSATLQGVLQLEDFTAETDVLTQPVTASGLLRFLGQQVVIDAFRGEAGDVAVEVGGTVDLESGLDVNIDVLPFNLARAAELVAVELPVGIEGDIEAGAEITGELENPSIFASVRNRDEIDIDVTAYAPVAVAVLETQVDVATTLNDVSAALEEEDYTGIEANADVELGINEGTIEIGTIVEEGNVRTVIESSSIALNPILGDILPDFPVALALLGANIEAEAEIEELIAAASESDFSGLQADVEVDLAANENPIAIDTQIDDGTVDIAVNSGFIELSNFFDNLLPDFPLDLAVTNTDITASAEIEEVLTALETQDLTVLDADVDVGLIANEGEIEIDTVVTEGVVDVAVNSSAIDLTNIANYFAPDIPISLALFGANLTASTEINDLLVAVETQNFDGINANADLQLAANEGNIDIETQVSSGNIDTTINSREIQLNPFVPDLPVAVALQESQIDLETSISQLLVAAETQDFTGLSLNADTLLGVNDGTVNANARIEGGAVDVTADISAISVENLLPDLPVAVSFLGGRVDVNTSLDALTAAAQTQDIAGLNTNADLQLAVNGSPINANARIGEGGVQLAADTGPIALDAFLPDLPASVALLDSNIRLDSDLSTLLAAAQTQDFSGVNADADLLLAVAGGRIDAIARLNSGILDLTADTTAIPLGNLVPNLPIAATLLDSQLNARLGLNALLAAAQTQDFNILNPDISLNARLGVGGGIVNTTTEIGGGGWQTAVVADDLNTSQLLRQVATLSGNKVATNPPLPPLNAQIDLAGPLAPLLALGTAPIPVRANTIAVQLGRETVNLNGDLVLDNLTTAPDISRLDLAIAANYNTRRLPLAQLISQATLGNATVPETVDINGSVEFAGRLQGRNLLSDPLSPGNVNLTGDLQLANLRLNDIIFDPVLAGDVAIRTGDEIALDLQGNRDRIAARLEPCNRPNACLLPYLPVSFDFRQGEGSKTPIIATGRRRGDILDTRLENFSVALLNIAPARELGIRGVVTGNVTADVALNLFTLETVGSVAVRQPGLGYLQAEAFAGDFAYTNGQTRLNNAFLEIGNSRYDVEAGIDLDLDRIAAGDYDLTNTPIFARVNIAEGYIEDLIALGNWFNIQDIIQRGGLGSPNLSAESLGVPAVGLPDSPLITQLNLFAAINARLQDRAAELLAVGPPTQLDITGGYTANLAVGGTFGNPSGSVEFDAVDWLWQPQPEFLAINDRLGLTIEEGRTIQIDRIIARGNLENGQLSIPQAELQVEDAVASLSAQASETNLSGGVKVENLSLDTIGNFVEIPPDVAATLEVGANFGGSPENFPENLQLDGQVAIIDPSWQGQPLDPLLAEFGYRNALFSFNTLEPSYIDIAARFPYPTTPETNDLVSLNVNVTTEATELLPVFTRGQAQWVGGDMALNFATEGRWNSQTEDPLILVPVLLGNARGNLNLAEATLKTPFLEETLTLNGELDFDPRTITANDIIGEFGGSTLKISGELPTLVPRDDVEPFTIALQEGELTLKGLFEGDLGGNVRITGAALTPTISGGVRVADGKFIVPVGNAVDAVDVMAGEGNLAAIATSEFETESNEPQVLPIIPTFDNFKVIVGEGFRIERSPVLDVRIEGKLALNGSIFDTQLQGLEPEGTIEVTRGVISIPLSETLLLPGQGSQGRFFIVRDRPQQVVFQPDRSILDPYVDLELGTLVFEDRRNVLRDRTEREIPDPDLFITRRPEQINVRIGIRGYTQDIVSSLENRSPDDDQLPPTVTLSSTPERSDAQIVRLLAGGIITSIEEIAQLEGSEFVEFALLRFVVQPIADDIIFQIEEFVSNAGQQVGLRDLRVFPIGQIEAIYDIDENSYLSGTYDYEFGDVRVEYNLRF